MVEPKIIAPQSRIEWIDIAKGFGIILVVLGHTGLSGNIAGILWAFHMPFFFFTSGLLFDASKYPTILSFAQKRFDNLLQPYIIFTAIVLIWIQILKSDIITGDLSVFYTGWMRSYPLWFIPVLFLSEIAYYAISKLGKSRALIILPLIISSVLGYLCYLKGVHLYYKIEVVLTALFFYGLGNQLSKVIILAVERLRSLNIFYQSLIFACFLALCFVFNSLNSVSLDLASNRIGRYFPAYLAAFSGIVMMFVFSSILTRLDTTLSRIFRGFISYIGKNSFVILAFHTIILTTYKELLANLQIPYYANSALRHLLMWSTLFLFIYLINNYCPWILGKKRK